MDSVQFSYPILIADGGEDLEFSNKIEEKNFQNIQFTYKHYGHDSSYQDYYLKIRKALSEIDTQYVVLADDDDFFLEEDILDSINFLESNPDYSSCGGTQAGIFNDSKTENINGNYKLKISPYRVVRLEDGNLIFRLEKHLQEYSSIYYDVHRTQEILDIYNSISKMLIDDLYMVEHYFQFASLSCGKNKKLASPYIVRQHNNPTSSALYSSEGGTANRIKRKSWNRDLKVFFSSSSSTHFTERP